MQGNIANITLAVPDTGHKLRPGSMVKLGRFETDTWVVSYGWFSFGGNRPWCGWYLTKDSGLTVKPLLLPDLDDIYLIEY